MILNRAMIAFLSQPWPWYVAGPLIGGDFAEEPGQVVCRTDLDEKVKVIRHQAEGVRRDHRRNVCRVALHKIVVVLFRTEQLFRTYGMAVEMIKVRRLKRLNLVPHNSYPRRWF